MSTPRLPRAGRRGPPPEGGVGPLVIIEARIQARYADLPPRSGGRRT